MKKSAAVLILWLMVWVPGASGFSIEWLTLDPTLAATGTFEEGWSNALPGWEITDGSRAWDEWTLSPGGAANRTRYDTNTSKLWLIFGNVSDSYTASSDSVVFLMHGDANDGYGRYVDDIKD